MAQDTAVGTQIMRVSATDVDEGENQKISYDLTATRIPSKSIQGSSINDVFPEKEGGDYPKR